MHKREAKIEREVHEIRFTELHGGFMKPLCAYR
jgi:hypothetical protein